MKTLILVISIAMAPIVSSQEFDLNEYRSETVFRDDITLKDMKELNREMTGRDVIDLLGRPEPSEIELPFLVYKASDDSENRFYLVILDPTKQEEKMLIDKKIIGVELSPIPWFSGAKLETIWSTETWDDLKKEIEANQSAHTTPASAPR